MIYVLGGGGANLNFQVVGGTTAPSNPKENTIWVNTSTAITSYIFSATEPSPAEAGMVWITIGTSSTVEFNALKKNGIQVYPISAKQYVSGAWVDKTAKSYQGGEWVDWILYLYNTGNQFTDLTGGWKAYEYTGGNYYKPSFTNSGIEINPTGSSSDAWAAALYTINAIDISQYKTLKATVACNAVKDSPEIRLGLSSAPGPGQDAFLSVKATEMSNGGTYTVELDLSTDGSFYVGFRVQHATIKVTKIWLEK